MKNYLLKLSAVTALHVGSGVKYSKKEYIYDESKRRVTLIDMGKVMGWLVRQNDPALIDAFETFMFSRQDNDLKAFLQRMRIPEQKIKEAEIYSLSSGDAFVGGGNKRDLCAFSRDERGRPYIPGSSLKGALRTALLVQALLDGEGYRGAIDVHDKKAAKKTAENIETALLHRFKRSERAEDPRNSLMSCLSVSDSAPLPQEAIILAGKDDIFTDGKKNSLPIVRECAAPGTEIRFRISISPAAKGSLSIEEIKRAVNSFGNYYQRTYLDKYPQKLTEDLRGCILLGGGCGYYAKNILYPAHGKDRESALRDAVNIMKTNFARHRHERDLGLGISPRALKCAQAGGRMRQMGICRVEIVEIEETK